ncbi:MAG: hypothetical protein V3S01_09370 [Dehalococcoidia bacterium]
MKLVALMYLEEDKAAVSNLLEEHGVMAYSRLPLEGHGTGLKGWLGDVAPYQSHMAFAMVPADKADALMEAVAECKGCLDPRHPIHAIQVDVEKAVNSGVPTSNPNR